MWINTYPLWNRRCHLLRGEKLSFRYSFIINPFFAKLRQWKPKGERIRLIKILLQQSWSHRYCISPVQPQYVFLARAHSIVIASAHSNVLNESLVPMIQLREMAFSRSFPRNFCHLGLQTRPSTPGNTLPIIFCHLRWKNFIKLKFAQLLTLNQTR